MACMRHYFLGETWGVVAYDDIATGVEELGVLDPRPRHGVYEGFGSPGSPDAVLPKVRGMLPEFGLAHWFGGGSSVTIIDNGMLGVSGGPISIGALVRPSELGEGRQRCIYQTGAAYLGLDVDGKVVFGTNGSPEITTAAALEFDLDYLVIATIDGSGNARLYVRHLIATETTVVTGPTAVSVGSHGASEIGGNSGSSYFVGGIQGVFILDEVMDADDVDELVQASIWIDVTPDVEIAAPVIIDQGIHDDGPLARISATGRCTLVMDNRVPNDDLPAARRYENAPYGYYSGPTSDTNRDGFTDGIPLRVSLPDPASPDRLRVQFIGRIRSIRPEAGIYRSRRTYIVGTDWMDEAARTKIDHIETQVDLTADKLIRVLLQSMRNRPHAISLETGSDDIPYAFHNVSENATILSELQKITLTEYGVTGLRWDGTLRFENRGARFGGNTVSHTIEDATEIDQERSIDQKHNLIKVTVHPATVSDDANTVLYTFSIAATPPDPALPIPNGPNAEIFFPFNDPNNNNVQIGAVEVQEPQPGVDYLINSAPDGSGVDLTSHGSIAIAWEIRSNGVAMTIENGYGQYVYMLGLQLIGRPIFTYNEVVLQADDPDSIADSGAQELTIDMPYQSDTGVGLALAQYLLSVFKQVSTRIRRCVFNYAESTAHINATLQGEISTRVHISELVSGVDADFFIQGRKIEWKQEVHQPDGEPIDHIIVSWYVQPVSGSDDGSPGGGSGGPGVGDFWELGIDTLGETTILGF